MQTPCRDLTTIELNFITKQIILVATRRLISFPVCCKAERERGRESERDRVDFTYDFSSEYFSSGNYRLRDDQSNAVIDESLNSNRPQSVFLTIPSVRNLPSQTYPHNNTLVRSKVFSSEYRFNFLILQEFYALKKKE